MQSTLVFLDYSDSVGWSSFRVVIRAAATWQRNCQFLGTSCRFSNAFKDLLVSGSIFVGFLRLRLLFEAFLFIYLFILIEIVVSQVSRDQST